MTDTPSLPADYVALRDAFSRACRGFSTAQEGARNQLDAFVAGLVRERDEYRAKHVRIKEHLRNVEAKSNVWKIMYKSERGSFEDSRHKRLAQIDRLRADLAACRAELAEAQRARNAYDSAHKREAANVLRLFASQERLRGALAHIREYWNGSYNMGAMSDALDHIVAEADAALASEGESQHE